ncbi:aldose epimerase family protein [Salinibacillus xinjiangensis]|uniref:Aldose 1-epimerase n=1 Tax=Salinibacillus xinjiangensis TaxID=1229268 RepID=A0A6G1X9P5_9BACI|nr:aldose epimerase family protein [Salinibacillus xinjiangensis]MRG87508.1 galactose-1-epimerase [Salinibacillus xinjiangensis]
MYKEVEEVQNQWKLIKLRNDYGMEVHVLNYGGIITRIYVPDREGKLENIVLGYENIEDYETDPNFFGALIGRVAGRIHNATFQLYGEDFELEKNDGPNNLHSGLKGFHRQVWNHETFQTEEEVGVKLSYLSKDGEGGFPGNVNTEVIYTLNQHNQLTLDYSATTDKETPLTMTNHTYFNLSGKVNHAIHNYQVSLDSRQFVELNEELIPTGQIIDVESDPLFDFRNERMLKEGIQNGGDQNRIAGEGYDHYFLFDHKRQVSAEVKDIESGRILSVETNQPGVVLYTSNNLKSGHKLTGGDSQKYLGLCLETQGTPASLHHKHLPSIIVNPDEVYKKQTIFTFGITKE